jgi:NAD(P)-dependent dehydrogenase (short-subunit alcohol dehydrogenase family)
MDLGMSGQVVLITGASKGIGLASARTLVEEGCKVVVTARNPDGLEGAVAELDDLGPGEAHGIAGDMTRPEDVERAVAETIDRYGAIDVLVTCAGSSPGVWKSSSRGYVSRISTSSFSAWLAGGKPARATTASSLRRTTGISLAAARYAAVV